MRCRQYIYKQISLFTIFFLSLSIVFYAQEKSTWVLNRVLNANNGLTQNTITDLYFDKETGLLWIGTDGGLVMYNGVSTKIYDTRNVPTFRMSRISAFTSTTDNKIIVLDKTAIGVRLSGNQVIASDHADYFGSTLPFYFQKLPRQSDTTWLRVQAELNKKLGSPLLVVSYLDDSTILVIKENATYIVGTTTSEIPTSRVRLEEAPVFLTIEPGRSFACLHNDGSGFFMDTKEKKTYPLKINHPDIKGLSIIRQDNINVSHCLLNGKKLYKLHINKNTVDLELLAVLPELPSNITSISVHSRNNQIFIGTLYEGLYIYTRSFFYTYQFNDPGKYTGKKDLSAFSKINNLYSGVLLDSNRVHLIHFNPAGLSQGVILNLNNGTFDFSHVRNAYAFKTAIDNRNNTLYFAEGGLTAYSFNSSGLTKSRKSFKTPAGFYYDSTTNKVWIADATSDILGYLDGDALQEYLRYNKAQSGVLNYIKRTNGLLIAYNEKGFFRIDETNRKLEQLYASQESIFRDIYIDQDNFAWITTYGKGIYMYDLNTKKIYHPRTDSKEFMLFSHCIIDDGFGNFFVPTNNGLFRINRKALIDACMDSTKIVFYHYYDQSNGLLQNEFNGGCLPAYNKLVNGDILLPSIQGLVRIFTSTISTPDNYPLFIQKITTPRQSYDFNNNMVFAANERTITWEVNFAQWEYPSTSGLAYQFDNDTNWTSLAAEERKIQLTDLKGGEHQLRIHNQFDLTGAKISTLTVNFEIKKKYFEKIWFWVFIAFLLFLVIYLTAALRNRQLKRKNIQLERNINKKTQEIRSKNSDLENTLSNLNAALEHLEQNSRFQQKLMGLLGHDIMIPLQYIAKVAAQLDTYRHKLSEETTSGAIHEIGTTATQLLYLGESIIHWIKLQEGNFIPRYSKINLHTLVKELVNLHQPLASDKKNIIKNEVPENFYCIQEPLIIKIILHNLLLNANKFTSNGIITITARCINDTLNLSVKDTGVGMDSTIVEELNNLQPVSSQKGTAKEIGWGLGYRFIIDLLKFVHGKFSIESEKGKGTTVIIDINLKNIVETEEV